MSDGPTIETGGPLRWSLAAALIVAAHAGLGWFLLNLSPADAMQGAPPAAITIDLEPLPAAPETPPQDVAPGPQLTEAQPEQKPDPIPEKPVEQVQEPVPEPTKQIVELPPPPEPAPVIPEEPKIEIPPLPEKDKAEAILTPPPPPKPVQKPPEPKPPKKQAEKKKPIDPDKPKRELTSAPAPTSQQSDRPSAAAPGVSTPSPSAISSWKSELRAHIEQRKRYPSSGTGSGVVATVTFTINGAGHVIGARLSGSSGDAALDSEAVATINRSSPVPAPPAGGPGTTTITLPIRFTR